MAPFECPQCGSRSVHHSRLRSWVESLRAQLTRRVPFRCHRCNWRGWRTDRDAEVMSGDESHRPVSD